MKIVPRIGLWLNELAGSESCRLFLFSLIGRLLAGV
jgi:hypothetical protein